MGLTWLLVEKSWSPVNFFISAYAKVQLYVAMGGEEGKQDVGHELRNSSVTLLQDDGFVFTAWATSLGPSGRSLMILMWSGDLGVQRASGKAFMAAGGTRMSSRRISLLCSRCGGTGLEQHSQSSLACISSRYLIINFGFMWLIQLSFFDSQLKFVLRYLVFLQLSSLFLLRCVFPTKLFYPDIRNYHSIPHLCFPAAAVG